MTTGTISSSTGTSKADNAHTHEPGKHQAHKQTHESDYCFHLKGNLLPFTVLELYFYSYTAFNQRLASLVKQAPSFFRDTPLIISLEKLGENHEAIDFIELTEICRAYDIYPIAVKGANDTQQINALIAGLPSIPAHNPTQKLVNIESEAAKDPASPGSASNASASGSTDGSDKITDSGKQPTSFKPAKIISRPIRSGQQIYAAESDLIIVGSVSEGAEILADGNVHVYGTLRGRALAGIKGYTDARIFCSCLEAELLSIAGRYKLHEDLKTGYWKAPIQANLVGSQLRLHHLEQGKSDNTH